MTKASFAFDDLDVYLSSDRSPESCMQLSDLDGFLTAIAIGPGTISKEEWLPVIWGGVQPKFRTAKEGKQILAAIETRYQEIVAGLESSPPVVLPVFWMQDGEPVVADWAEGFMDGVRLRLDAWSRLIASRDNTILVPLAAYWLDDDGQPIIHVDDEVRERIDEDAAAIISETVIAIYRYWRSHVVATKPVVRLH